MRCLWRSIPRHRRAPRPQAPDFRLQGASQQRVRRPRGCRPHLGQELLGRHSPRELRARDWKRRVRNQFAATIRVEETRFPEVRSNHWGASDQRQLVVVWHTDFDLVTNQTLRK